LLVVCGFAWSANAAPQITLADYIWTLGEIHSLAKHGHIEGAKVAAAQLKGAEVSWSGGTISVDQSLLDAIANAKRADRALVTRIEVTIEELRRSGATSTGADPKLLQQVAAEQEVPELAPGGQVPTKVDADLPLLERIGKSIGEMLEWIGEKIDQFLDWLRGLFPESRPDRGATFGMRWIVITVVALIVVAIIILAIEVTRRSKRGTKEVATSEPISSRRDEDPLSRGASEWERYAAQLAAAGRFREAIRAWYHAVLVTCYAEGVLHFRKGRTNWEYVSLLSPSLAWRSELIQLTRRFEREWYGADESTSDALEECSDGARGILDAIRRRGAA
jgi:hypothetical protein